MALIVQNEELANDQLERGVLSCPCGGQLRPWGYSAPRVVRRRGGGEQQRRWRRARCGGCGVTHVLCWGVVPRRRDEIATIGSALTAAAVEGIGHRPIATRLGLPAATVRGWLRRVRAGSAWIGSQAMRWACRLDANMDRRHYQPDPLAEVVDCLGIAAAAAVHRFGPPQDPWRLAVRFTDGRLLSAPSG